MTKMRFFRERLPIFNLFPSGIYSFYGNDGAPAGAKNFFRENFDTAVFTLKITIRAMKNRAFHSLTNSLSYATFGVLFRE
jgi:hypothetical protein